ncbi:hypothetical protein HanPSC8_Chr03g0107441 [Helianthus annuus]|nr:hypothetical protein HanPSC8_Chr03g0107441 [Helianthus annuus]
MWTLDYRAIPSNVMYKEVFNEKKTQVSLLQEYRLKQAGGYVSILIITNIWAVANNLSSF